MNKKSKWILGFIFILVIIAVISFATIQVYQGRELGLYDFFTISLLIGGFFYLITWDSSSIYGPESEDARDEMGKHIKKASSNISYFIMMVVTVVLAYMSSDAFWLSHEIALYLIMGLFFIVNPITQFFIMKKYR